MRKLIHFWLGWARICVSGPFPERFLNLCGVWELPFWEVQQGEKGSLLVCVPAYALSKSRVAAERAQCTMEVVERQGLSALILRLKKRYGFWVGLALSAVTAVVLSQFILVVNVKGNIGLSDSVILTELSSLGFGVGSYGPSVDERTLSNSALLKMRELSYLNINISGIFAQVEVRERQPLPEMRSEVPSDLIAAADGVVEEVEVLSGEARVEAGQAVLAGEVLISGTNTYLSGDGTGTVLSERAERAEGTVWARTERTLYACTPMTLAAKRLTGAEKHRYALRIFKYPIKIWGNSSIFHGECDTITDNHTLCLPGGLALPLTLSVDSCTQWERVEATAEDGAALTLLQERLQERLNALMGQEGSVLSASWSQREENGLLVMSVRAACREQIALTQEHTRTDLEMKIP